ncbi:flagellar hook-associated protein FlgK [Gracilibacillus caseinilyticus]|uniref:Flagellar hook-associated protein 1 n=1 Tax=Gracilibacillus caseinilyticus TaxID=2932256 RepID=A0ABY4EV70_9BACI|nr:flagellar hook-associated protein FlgK [Gracilibacillus caseinilyticus]UOQ48308.1 flagellar hook-associated protein FlgK [Gracilibacillus caseinilyticus]
MSSTFSGLEVAKRALNTQQSALYTTGHNIANANTEGYTRQRVNMSQTAPFPPASRNRPEIPGQVGSGVEVGSIERVRDSFIDKQYRQENSKVGFYESKADTMSKLESILNEPTDQGLSSAYDQFWQSLQDLSVNPEDSGARSVVKERANALADAFNYVDSSLEDVRANLKNEIGVNNSKINSLIDQINELNGQISNVEPHGYVPNDLYDERDRLVDELSSYVDIKVDYRKSSGQPSPIAQGIATITLVTDNEDVENDDGEPITLVDGSAGADLGSDQSVNHIFSDFDDDNNLKAIFFDSPNSDLTVEEQTAQLAADYDNQAFIYGGNFDVQGKLNALIDGAGYLDGFSYDGTDTGTAAGEINEMLADIDKMVEHFVTEFNAVHQTGYTLATDQDGNAMQGGEFFTGTTADTIAVSQDILDDVDLIAASSTGASGDGGNATALADVYTKRVENFLSYDAGDANQLDDKATIKSYFESIIGEMGVVAEESNRMYNNSQILRQQVEESRQSISSVSLDEEMTNMIQFQHAYNAAARNMTVVDEMLDKIINNMGLVGR